MDAQDNISPGERALLLVLLVALFAFGLFDHTLWSSNDPREGGMIWDMYRNGTWVTPSMNGEPFLEKPPLLHWTSLLFCYAFGRVNEGLVRLPAALYGFGAVFVVYLFSRRLRRERAGFAAAFMCGTSLLYMEHAKVVLTDMALTFMVNVSLYLFWVAYTEKRAQGVRYALFILVSAAAFYAKGLLGPGFIWVTVTVFLLIRREWKRCLILCFLFVPVFIIVLAPWVWALWQKGGSEFLRIVFIDNQLGRFFTFSDTHLPHDPYLVHKEPFYFYFITLPLRLTPWFLLVPPALFHWFRPKGSLQEPLHLFLRTAFISMAMILQISSAKVECYALPIFPILFLLVGIWIDDVSSDVRARVAKWVLWITAGTAGLVSFVLPSAYLILFFMPESFYARISAFGGANPVREPGLMKSLLGLALAVLLLAVAVFATWTLWRDYRGGRGRRAALALPAVVAAIFILGGSMIIPAYDHQATYKPFADLIRTEMESGRKIGLATDEQKYIGALTFYADSRFPIVQPVSRVREFLHSNKGAAGVMVEKKQLAAAEEALSGTDYRILKSDHTGYKCDYFRLVVKD